MFFSQIEKENPGYLVKGKRIKVNLVSIRFKHLQW